MNALDAQIQSFDDSMIALSQNVTTFKSVLTCIAPTMLSISTMTILFKTNCNVNKNKLFVSIMTDLPYGQDQYSNISLRKKKEGKSYFLNCLIFEVVLQNTDTLSKKAVVKLFSNGSLHVTGGKTVADAKKAAAVVCGVYQSQKHKLSEQNRIEELVIVGFDIQMINSNFRVDIPLNLDITKHILNLNYNSDATLNREHHPGVIIKYRNEQLTKAVSILIFISGSIIITGAKCASDLYECYAHICRIVNENIEEIRLKTPYTSKKDQPKGLKKRGRKKKSVTESFYNDFLL